MLEPAEIIRQRMEAWAQDQQEYATHMAESLAALEAYEEQLGQWQSELESRADLLDQQQEELETRRKQLAKQQATDIAVTAELDQARAEIEELRQRLDEVTDPVVLASAAATADADPPNTSSSGNSVGLMDPAVSVVAKQFQKLRQQQAARRNSSRSSDS